jgi:outer membrane protein OmpA-like peptidoglycan-associated protein
VPATGEVLGALKWGVSWGPDWSKVLGGEPEDCSETASAAFGVALERFYATPKTIDVAQTRAIGDQHYAAILEGFVANDATLTADHKKRLDAIVAQLEKFSNLSATLGGFADAGEKDPFGVSELRAEQVRSYLLGRGVRKDRIETGGFGAAWARFRPGAKESRNRRVQILLHF